MNSTTRISVSTPAAPPLVPAGSAQEVGTALPAAPVRRTIALLENELTAPMYRHGKANGAAAAIGSNVLEQLRVLRGAESTQLSLALTRGGWWMETFSQLLTVSDQPFFPPHITITPENEVAFEWWSGDKKLTIYAAEGGMQLVRVWGADIFDEMEHALLDSPYKALSTWQWLLSNG